jgi:NADH-quinone oxidoreductase subunit J
VSQVLFAIIAGPALLMALLTVLARDLVHAALYLVAFFFLVACLFVLLEAEFLAVMQVLVYIGAVAILLLFGVMLTRNVRGYESTRLRAVVVVPAAAVALGTVAILVFGALREPGTVGRPAWSAMLRRPPSAAATPSDPLPPRAPAINNMARVIGDELMGRYVVAFELAGLLLTVAVVGAVAISVRDRGPDATSVQVQTEEPTLSTASVAS